MELQPVGLLRFRSHGGVDVGDVFVVLQEAGEFVKGGALLRGDFLELELIDYGAEEVFKQEVEDEDENVTVEISIYGDYTAYGQIQKYIEEKGYELVSGGFEQIPNVVKA